MTIASRSLGGLDVPALGFGCMGLTKGMYGENVDTEESERTLRKALDLGLSPLSTADFYTSHVSGELHLNIKMIGKVMKDYPREKIVIAMKIGPWVEAGFKPFDLSADALRQRVDKALEILGTDYVDFLIYRYLPNPDTKNTSVEDVARNLKAILDSGKAKAIGVSELPASDFEKFHAIVPIKLVELEWSLFTRDSEKETIPLARKVGAGILAYSPMGRGVLTGKFDASKIEKGDFRNTTARTTGDALTENQKLVEAVAEMAKEKGCTPGQLAVAWVLAQGEDVVPIPGTKRVKYLEENVKSLDVKLTKEDLDKLREIVPADKVAGARY